MKSTLKACLLLDVEGAIIVVGVSKCKSYERSRGIITSFRWVYIKTGFTNKNQVEIGDAGGIRKVFFSFLKTRCKFWGVKITFLVTIKL